MARVNVINLNLVQLPKTACLNPSPSFYSQCVCAAAPHLQAAHHCRRFNGYTLGLLFAMLGMGCLYLLGVKVVARVSLRGMDEEERVDRIAKFSSTMLSRTLLVLYIVYPGVSVAIFQIFSCTKLKSGAAYLDADFNIVCYDSVHWRYVGGAVIWLFVVPIGVPAFFIWLLRRFKVPQMAKLLTESAWLREAVKLAWQSGVAQPALDVAKLNVDNITDAHLEGLHAFFLREASAEVAGDIANGKAPRLPDEPEPEAPPPPTGMMSIILARLKAAATRAVVVLQRAKLVVLKLINPDTGVHGHSPEAERRAFVLEALLAWCQTSGKLALPPMSWEEVGEAFQEDASQQPSTRLGSIQLVASVVEGAEASKAPAVSAGVVHYDDLPRLQTRAMKEVGFLFA